MKLRAYRHLIWDWNGTLLDDAWLCRKIMNGQLRRRGLPILSQEKYEEIFDFPVEKYYRAVGFDWSRESFQDAGTEFIVEYEKRKTECSLQSGARELLGKIAEGGWSQAVLSAYSHQTLEEFLRQPREGLLLLASLQPGAITIKEALAKASAHPSITVLVGPEGDFTPEESATALAAGAIPVTLGPMILRAETAALYCLSVLGHELF